MSLEKVHSSKKLLCLKSICGVAEDGPKPAAGFN